MSAWADSKRAAKKQRIEAVRSMHLQVGEWVARGSSRHIFRLHESDLDARKLDFELLHRATPEQIAERENKDAESARARAELEELRSLPEYKIASRLASTDTDKWLRLELNQLEHIARILDTTAVLCSKKGGFVPNKEKVYCKHCGRRIYLDWAWHGCNGSNTCRNSTQKHEPATVTLEARHETT